jgi:hypothetical protein
MPFSTDSIILRSYFDGKRKCFVLCQNIAVNGVFRAGKLEALVSGFSRNRAIFIAAGWVALALAFFAPSVVHPPGKYDEGFMVCGAERVLRGELPYRDFNSGYPPAQFYTIAAVFRIFGRSLLAERIWDGIWRLATVALVVGLVKAVGGRGRILLLLCIGAWTGVIAYHLYPMITATTFCVGSLWCCIRYLNGCGLRWMFFSGLIAGAGLLYRHDLLLGMCGAVIATTVYLTLTEERKCAEFKGAAAFVAGVVMVFAPIALLIWTSVPHAFLKQSFVDFPRITSGEKFLRFYVVPSIWQLGDFYLPLTILAAAAYRLWRTEICRRPIPLLLFLAAFNALAVATPRLDMAHAYPAMVLSLVLLSWYLAQSTSGLSGRLDSVLRVALLSTVTLLYGLPAVALWTTEVSDIRVQPLSGIARAGPIPLDPDQRDAVQYIQRKLSPAEFIFVGTTSHSRQFSNDALFYFLSSRPQATRWDMWVPGITTEADVQSEIADALEKRHVRYVVLFAARLPHEPNRSSVDNGITILDDAIHGRYTEVARFGRYAIRNRTAAFERAGE